MGERRTSALDHDVERQAAARESLRFVRPGMIVGLGSGRTAEHMIRALGESVRAGLEVRGIPTSERTRQLADQEKIPLVELNATNRPDLTIDGADEVDRAGNLIKGGGGALLREKIVAANSDRLIIIVDSAKLVDRLGACPVPVEVIPFGAAAVAATIGALGADVRPRVTDTAAPILTDQGNLIFDCAFGPIDAPEDLASELIRIPGVVEHGLFVGQADLVIVGTQGDVEVWEPHGRP